MDIAPPSDEDTRPPPQPELPNAPGPEPVPAEHPAEPEDFDEEE